MSEGRDYPADIENAPCERCEKPVHLQHDPPCPHGVVVCDMCDIDKECLPCAQESEREMFRTMNYDARLDPFVDETAPEPVDRIARDGGYSWDGSFVRVTNRRTAP